MSSWVHIHSVSIININPSPSSPTSVIDITHREMILVAFVTNELFRSDPVWNIGSQQVVWLVEREGNSTKDLCNQVWSILVIFTYILSIITRSLGETIDSCDLTTETSSIRTCMCTISLQESLANSLLQGNLSYLLKQGKLSNLVTLMLC